MKRSYKKGIILSITVILLVSAVYSFISHFVIWEQTGWVGIEFTPVKSMMERENINPRYLGLRNGIVQTIFLGGPAQRSGIKRGDEIITINNISITETEKLESLSAQVKIGDTLSFQMKRGKKQWTVLLVLEPPLQSKQIIVSLQISLPVALIFFVIGFFVFWQKPEDRRAQVFYIMSLVAATSYFLDTVMQADSITAIGLSSVSIVREVTRGDFFIISGLFFLATLFHLSLIFPKERKIVQENQYIIPIIYVLPVLSVIAVSLFRKFNISPTFRPVIEALLILLLISYPIGTFVALGRSYRNSGIEEKRQVRWPLWGTILAVVGVFLPLLVFELLEEFFGGYLSSVIFDEIGKAFFLLIPISFAFAILKYRLMDIDLIIKKTIVYSVVSSITVALYFSLVRGLGTWLANFAEVNSEFLKFFFTLAIAAVLLPVRTRVLRFVDRRFFKKKFDYPKALSIISNQISEGNDLQKMLQQTAEQLVLTMQIRTTVIFLKNSRDKSFWARAKIGVPDEVLDKLKFEQQSKVLQLLEKMIDVPKQDFPDDERRKLRKIGSALLIPFKQKGELLGFLSLSYKLPKEDFDTEDKDFLYSVATQIAVGIENFKLRDHGQELSKARDIQQGLLPKYIPQIQGFEISGAWQTAQIVGGDYYDVLKFQGNKIGLCVADAVMHGMPAALLVSNLQAVVRAFASEVLLPDELCEKVNRVISTNVTGGKAITFFYSILDGDAKKLSYTNAGHTPPIILRHSGEQIFLDAGGAGFGVFQEWNYQRAEVQLYQGDKILLYTDGITQAKNYEGREFGKERVVGLVIGNRNKSAQELQKILIDAVAEFCGGDFQDDIAMIVISVQ